MYGLKNVLESVRKTDTIKTFVLTSSISAMAPKPEPVLLNENHWSDVTTLLNENNWFSYTKTC